MPKSERPKFVITLDSDRINPSLPPENPEAVRRIRAGKIVLASHSFEFTKQEDLVLRNLMVGVTIEKISELIGWPIPIIEELVDRNFELLESTQEPPAG